MFDFDGTLIDSMPFLEKNAVTLLSKYYAFSKEEACKKYRETTGLPFVQQMEIIAPKNKINTSTVEEFERMKLDLIYEQRPFNDALDVLRTLKEQKYLLGISSGTIETIITTYLDKVNFGLVNDIMGYRPGFEKGKDHFDYILSKYSLKPEQVLFIGDSLHDAKRARNNNILFIGRKGMFQKEHFETIIPDCVVIQELSQILNNL
jgi:phosphoglycolate phosphatase-like HAD superfamily hydrolase